MNVSTCTSMLQPTHQYDTIFASGLAHFEIAWFVTKREKQSCNTVMLQEPFKLFMHYV